MTNSNARQGSFALIAELTDTSNVYDILAFVKGTHGSAIDRAYARAKLVAEIKHLRDTAKYVEGCLKDAPP